MVAAGKGGRPRPFSREIFGTIVGQWQDWRRGVPPSRQWRGRGGQNPHLLAAFDALDRAEFRATDYFRRNPPKSR